MRLLQFLLAVLTQLLLQGAVVHGKSSISSPLQPVLKANNELFSALADHDVYNVNKSALNVLQIFPGLSRFTALVFSTAPLLDFIASSSEESHPAQETIREMISKINSSLSEADSLEKHESSSGVWTDYARKCGKDDSSVRKAWVFLKDFLEKGPTAKTMEEKLRLAGQFTTFYIQTDMDKTVKRLHRHITDTKAGFDNPKDNLPSIILHNSNYDFYLLGRYSSYLSTLMVLGLQMRVYHHTLMNTSGMAKAKTAMTQLSDVYLSLQNAQLECLKDFSSGVHMEVIQMFVKMLSKINYSRPLLEVINEEGNPIVAHLSDPKTTSDVENHLNAKYSCCDWTVVSIIWRTEDQLRDGFDMAFGLPWTSIGVYLKYVRSDVVHAKQPCTEELCPSQSGHCRNITALDGDICQCATMFYGTKCKRNIQDDIDLSLLVHGDNPIIIPDLTTTR